jgi:methanogenic corrinoid protein MtbC1
MPNSNNVTGQVVEALLHLDSRRVRSLLADLPSASDGLYSLEEVVVPALEYIGRAWQEGRIALSQVYMAGRMCEAAISEVLPPNRQSPEDGPRLAIGVLEDHHALGKRMVKSVLHSAGFQPVDYGQGLRSSELTDMAVRDEIDLLLISCLMLASAVRVEEVVAGLRRAGSPAAVVVGGAPFRLDPGLWKEVGAQAMGGNSTDAVGLVQSWVRGPAWA